MRIIVQAQEANATQVIQKALDDVFAAGGGVVEISKGTYSIGAIRIRSNTALYLKSGAVLKGTRVPDDYDILEYDKIEPLCESDLKKIEFKPHGKVQTEDGWVSGPCSRWNHAIIRVFEAENVSIIGEENSIIDGSDCYDALGEESFRGPHGISLFRSENVVCKGYTIQNTGNWAHITTNSSNLIFKNITVLAGHDGIHMQGTDNVLIDNCKFFTGDDCVAGVDNTNIHVKNCVMNTACSAFRFGGTNLIAENCSMYGPGKYPIRGSLPLEDKINGTSNSNSGRKNMLSIFTYFADFTFQIRNLPSNLIFRNCQCENIDRFINYDYSGNSCWQCNRPLSSVSFENFKISNIRIPLFLHGDEKEPVSVALKNIDINFAEYSDALIYAKNCKDISIDNVNITGLDGNLIKSWGNIGNVSVNNVTGVKDSIIQTDEPWDFKTI